MIKEDYWGNLTTKKPKDSPRQILEEQVAILEDKTENQLTGSVASQAIGNRMRTTLAVIVPELDYRLDLVTIDHDVNAEGFYPLRIENNLTNTKASCEKEDMFKIKLKEILSSSQTTSTLQKLLEAIPMPSRVSVHSDRGYPISEATVVAIADNGTTKSAKTDQDGVAHLFIATTRPYKLLVAHRNFPGQIVDSWDSSEVRDITLPSAKNTGSVICMSTGYIPNLEGRLNPILDSRNRTYIYAENIAINGSDNQPVTFKVNEPFELEDSNGVVMRVRVLHIQGRTSLLEYTKKYND